MNVDESTRGHISSLHYRYLNENVAVGHAQDVATGGRTHITCRWDSCCDSPGLLPLLWLRLHNGTREVKHLDAFTIQERRGCNRFQGLALDRALSLCHLPGILTMVQDEQIQDSAPPRSQLGWISDPARSMRGEPPFCHDLAADDDNQAMREDHQQRRWFICRLYPAFSSSMIALCLSFAAMLIGLSLLVLSTVHHNTDRSSNVLGTDNFAELTLAKGDATNYWLLLKEMIESATPKDHRYYPLLLPDSAQWKALKWLVTEDPLAVPYYQQMTAALGNATILGASGRRIMTTLDATVEENGITTVVGDTGQVPMNATTAEPVIVSILKQRYALVVFYFHFNGDSWALVDQAHGWLRQVSIRRRRSKSNSQGVVPVVDSSKRGIATQESPTASENVTAPPSSDANQGTPSHECDWLGITCLNSTVVDTSSSTMMRTLIGIEFLTPDWVFLSGTLPTELGMLTALEALQLPEQSIRGDLFPRVDYIYDSWKNLHTLNLYFNQLSGTLSAQLGSFKAMKNFNLGDNHLRGPVPAQAMTNWTWLATLDLSANEQLYGNIWNYTIYWPWLEQFSVSGTRLSGRIPDLAVMKLPSSRATLPDNTPLPLSRLKILDAGRSDLTGYLPSSLSLATDLEYLDIGLPNAHDKFRGSIPTEFGSLTSLKAFAAVDVQALTGTLPSQLGLVTALTSLDLRRNVGLTGTLPTELGQLSSVQYILLSDTRFRGTVPSEIGMCANLTTLELQSTDLTGTMPDQICALGLSELTADCAISGGNIVVEQKISCPQDCCTKCFASY